MQRLCQTHSILYHLVLIEVFINFWRDKRQEQNRQRDKAARVFRSHRKGEIRSKSSPLRPPPSPQAPAWSDQAGAWERPLDNLPTPHTLWQSRHQAKINSTYPCEIPLCRF